MRLKEQIDFLVSQVLLEIRSNFKWNEFKAIKSPGERLQYLDKTKTTKLGEGSSRIAYLLSNRYVLKLALPEAEGRGKAQNKEEVNVGTNPVTAEVVASVYDFAPDYSWIVSEVVREVTNEKEIEEQTGIPFYPMIRYLKEVFDTNTKDPYGRLEKFEQSIERSRKIITKFEELLQDLPSEEEKYRKFHENDLRFEKEQLETKIKDFELYKAFDNSPFVQGLASLILNQDAMAADMGKVSHWGKTASGKIVLLDYGYSRDIARKHYNVNWV